MTAKKSARKTAAKRAKKKTTVKASDAKTPGTDEEAGQTDAASGAAGDAAGVSSLDVNLGHVFSLRPRVPKAFKPDDLRAAKQALADRSFDTIEQAARAVAEEALGKTQSSGRQNRFGRRRRF